MSKDSSIKIYKIRLPITGTEGILNVCGDFHYGADGMTDKEEIVKALNKDVDLYQGNIFRILTGDLIENQLKTSVGHNYDVGIPDPSDQKFGIIDILNRTNKYLYGDNNWKKLTPKKLNPTTLEFDDIRCVGVEGNHEYRTRKVSGQWLSKEIHNSSKVLDLGINGIIELTIFNKKFKLERTFKIFVAHRPSNSCACSSEAMIRAFRKKQSQLPGIDLIVFGHTHHRHLSADSYTDTSNGDLRKVLYVVNPSPMSSVEYAQEAGYPPLESGFSINVHLPLDLNLPIWGKI